MLAEWPSRGKRASALPGERRSDGREEGMEEVEEDELEERKGWREEGRRE